jgi:hypothetical protein
MNKLLFAAALASSVSLPEILLWFCFVFLALLGLITLCRYCVNCLTSVFDAGCDRLECRLAERKKRRAVTDLQAVPSALISRSAKADESANHSVPTASRKRPLGVNRHLRVVSAQDALRRNAESSHAVVSAE